MADRAAPAGPATDVAALRAIEMDDVDGDPERFVRAVERLIEAFRRWAASHKRNYNWLRAALVVLSAALPALTVGTSATMRVVAAVVSAAVAALAGLEGFLRPAQLWQHSKTAEMTLRSLLRQYRLDEIALEGLTEPELGKKRRKLYLDFVAAVGRVREEEALQFVTARLRESAPAAGRDSKPVQDEGTQG